MAAWEHFRRSSREESLRLSLDGRDRAFLSANEEIDAVRRFVGSPGKILGSEASKHGEVAEQVHVGCRRARDLLYEREPSATFERVPRTGPADYIQDGVEIQSKYINGLRNTLDHVGRHAAKYPARVEEGLTYHVPRDQYDQLRRVLAGESVEGFSPRSASTIQSKLEQMARETGRPIEELIRPGEADYAEVQMGKVRETLDARESELRETRSTLDGEDRIRAAPGLAGLGKAAGLGAAAGAGVGLGKGLWVKWRTEGRNPFAGEFTGQDWRDLGLETARGASMGAVSGGGLYLLTNYTGLAAPFAGAVVSTTLGISSLVQRHRRGVLAPGEFVEVGMVIAAEASVVGLATYAGQVLVPVPILGAFVGSLSGKLLCGVASKFLSEAGGPLARELERLHASCTAELDAREEEVIRQVSELYDNLRRLIERAFDPTIDLDLRLRFSAEVARVSGVPDQIILRSPQDVDRFMQE